MEKDTYPGEYPGKSVKRTSSEKVDGSAVPGRAALHEKPASGKAEKVLQRTPVIGFANVDYAEAVK